MRVNNMRWIKIDTLQQAEKVLMHIGVDSKDISSLTGKALTQTVKLDKVSSAVALTLKQEMLSLGGDAAVHRELLAKGVGETDVLLFGNFIQLHKLIYKLSFMPLEFKSLGESLLSLLSSMEKSSARILDCRGIPLELGKKTLIMGILNVTPDSFSDGGQFLTSKEALKQAERMVVEGADIIDIGGESSRPGYSGISAEEEWARLESILKELVSNFQVPISLDTQKAVVAAKALKLGVHIINDIWGLQKDRDMAGVLADYRVPVVIMHNRDNSHYTNLMGEILEYLERSVETALRSGLSENQIILDPGIGFGKTPEQNMEVLSRLDEFRILGYPILLGVSRKSVIGKTLNLPIEQRLAPTIALGVLGVAAGVEILRVHDVLEHKRAILMTDQIVRRKRGEDYEGK